MCPVCISAIVLGTASIGGVTLYSFKKRSKNAALDTKENLNNPKEKTSETE